MAVFVSNESDHPVDIDALMELSRHLLAEMGVDPLAELSVLLVDTPAMTKLHERWMGEPGPTDVLAFPMDELEAGRGDDDDPHPALLGDVVLCPQVAEKQAETAGHSAEDELHVLCTHGVLHLLGYDHGEPEEERLMFREQARLIASWQAARATPGEA
jgi:probable rRNA maturation factor